jgi:hypothetical protein
MAVWLARTDGAARPTPFPTVATNSTVTASTPASGRGKPTRPITDGEEPRNSADAGSYFDWWPVNGCRADAPASSAAAPAEGARRCSEGEWLEMAFEKPATVSLAEVYWFDDTGRGGVRVPASWRLLYKDGDSWKPVETTTPFGVTKDAWNSIAFKPVSTTALRIELTMQPGMSAGIHEWKVK